MWILFFSSPLHENGKVNSGMRVQNHLLNPFYHPSTVALVNIWWKFRM